MHYLSLLIILLFNNVFVVSSAEKSNRLFNTDLYEEALDPVACEQQLSYLSNENTFLRNRFLDAGIRFPKGFFAGNTVDFGNYYQCLGINEQFDDNEIQGKYCFISVFLGQGGLTSSSNAFPESFQSKFLEMDDVRWEEINKYKKMQAMLKSISGQRDDDSELDDTDTRVQLLRLAVCVPKTCTTQQAFNEFLPLNLSIFGFSHEVEFCRLPNDKRWVTADYIATVIFSLIGLLTLISTCYDVYNVKINQKDPKEVSKIYRSFSVYTNLDRLLTFKSSAGSLHCLDGIRSLAMMWILVGHTFVVPLFTLPIANFGDMMEWSAKYRALFITAAPISVDTFFMLGGLLAVYTTAGKLDSRGLIKNIHLFYLNRILRMFPILASAVLFEASLFNHVTDGPYLTSLDSRTNNCRNNWWTTFLYVQNYVNPSSQCLGHTWYLDIDIQLHILLPLVLFWILRGKKDAWIAMTAALLMSLTGATIYNFNKNFPAGTWVPSRFGEDTQYMAKYYFNTLTRASPFFVGLFFGYLLHLHRGKKVIISKALVALFWIMAAGLSCWVVSFTYLIIQWDWDNQLVDNLMNSFMRPIWATALGWMIFACVHGYGGPVNWFLSLKVWKLPARISFAMYIFHYSLIYLTCTMELQPFYFTVQAFMFRFFADYALTIIVSFIVTLFIDYPFSTIFNVVLGAGIKKTIPPKTDPNQPQEQKDTNNKEIEVYANNEEETAAKKTEFNNTPKEAANLMSNGEPSEIINEESIAMANGDKDQEKDLNNLESR